MHWPWSRPPRPDAVQARQRQVFEERYQCASQQPSLEEAERGRQLEQQAQEARIDQLAAQQREMQRRAETGIFT